MGLHTLVRLFLQRAIFAKLSQSSNSSWAELALFSLCACTAPKLRWASPQDLRLINFDNHPIFNIWLRSKKFNVQIENKANSAQVELELWLSLAIKTIYH